MIRSGRLGQFSRAVGDRQARHCGLKQGPESSRSEECASLSMLRVSPAPLFLSRSGLLLVSFCVVAFVHILAAEGSLSATSYLWGLGPLM